MLRKYFVLATAVVACGLTSGPCFAAEQTPTAGIGASATSTALNKLFEDYFERQL